MGVGRGGRCGGGQVWRFLKKTKFVLTFSDVHFQNLQIKAIDSLSFVKKKKKEHDKEKSGMALSDGKKTSNEKETFLLSKTWKTILATRLPYFQPRLVG